MEKSKLLEKVSDYIDLNYESECTRNLYKSYSKKFIYSSHPDSIEKLTNAYLVKYLLSIKQGGKYSKTSVNNLVKKYIGKEYSIHWLRHLGITYIINKNYSLPKAKLFSRHKSDSAIQFYYHYDENSFNELRQSLDKIAI